MCHERDCQHSELDIGLKNCQIYLLGLEVEVVEVGSFKVENMAEKTMEFLDDED